MGLINNLTEFHSEFLVELYFNLIKEKIKKSEWNCFDSWQYSGYRHWKR